MKEAEYLRLREQEERARIARLARGLRAGVADFLDVRRAILTWPLASLGAGAGAGFLSVALLRGRARRVVHHLKGSLRLLLRTAARILIKKL